MTVIIVAAMGMVARKWDAEIKVQWINGREPGKALSAVAARAATTMRYHSRKRKSLPFELASAPFVYNWRSRFDYSNHIYAETIYEIYETFLCLRVKKNTTILLYVQNPALVCHSLLLEVHRGINYPHLPRPSTNAASVLKPGGKANSALASSSPGVGRSVDVADGGRVGTMAVDQSDGEQKRIASGGDQGGQGTDKDVPFAGKAFSFYHGEFEEGIRSGEC